MAQTIVAEPLNPRGGFNWVFLVELLICGILTVFFLFYFNRLFATLVSYGIRAYTWRAFNAYIDITSLQISPLGGRIFFKTIRYHGHNETILVHGGYITWNYWLRRVRDAAIFSNEQEPPDSDNASRATSTRTSGSRSRTADRAEKGGKQTPKPLPCRISVKISGLEAFMYNRSPAYDGIIDAVKKKMDEQKTELEKEHGEDGHNHNKLKKSQTEEKELGRAGTARSSGPETKKPELPAFLRLLPIHVDISRGAIVVGNENTPSVITAQFEKASGTLDAGPCGPQDVYQQLFNFQATHPVVHMKPNPDFKTSQLDTAAQIKRDAGQNDSEETLLRKNAARLRSSRWLSALGSLKGLFAKSSDSVHTHTKFSAGGSELFAPHWQFPGQDNWKGLARYLDDSVNDGHGEWDAIEYAKTSLIADIPCVNVAFYWDVTGPVTSDIDNGRQFDPTRPNDINGSIPPEYGMDIQVFGGTINYGPWTDRHRGIFQNIFFPGSHVDGKVAPALKPGDARVLTVFKLFLSIEEDTVLRIPTRESSKDWKWKGKAHTLAAHEKSSEDKSKGRSKARRRRGKGRDAASAQNVRSFAWIDIKVTKNTSVNYVMDMYASKSGFQNQLDVDVASVEISSSVNHGLLWRSGSITLDCNLSNPLSWNTLRTWLFNIKCRDLELFLLRDHLFLLTDLVADWGSGPPSDYFLFVPFRYLLNIDFTNFKLYLNTNDSNIVNNPADLDDNNFIILTGQQLHGDVVIPLDKFRPRENEIKFDVHGHNMGLEILMPPKNTVQTFVRSSNVARLGGLTLVGSHTYMSETSTANTDRLFMDIQGDKLNLELYGWLVHHFMKIKDNYFGDDLHFKTLEEFQGLPATNLAADGTAPNGQPTKLSNDLDVVLSISATQGSVLVPSNLYSAERSIRADIAYVSADLRFTNYYMDLMVNFSPINIALGGAAPEPETSHEFTSGHTELFIDSTVIFGHRLFGLPPTEPTYICSWDFDVGLITGECSSEFIGTAVGAARAFAFTFDDDENSLPLTEIAPIHDATFLQMRTRELNVWLNVGPEALQLKTGAISMDFNDLAGSTFSQRLNAYIPDLTISGVDARSASRQRTRQGGKQSVETHAFFQTSLSLGMLARKLEFSEERAKQQAHMKLHDLRTKRAQFMFRDEADSSFYSAAQKEEATRPPAMQFPDIAQPIFLFQPGGDSFRSSPSSTYATSVRKTGQSFRTRTPSIHSLARSIRSTRTPKTGKAMTTSSRSETVFGGSPERAGSQPRNLAGYGDSDYTRRDPTSLSVALSSSLSTPHFPLHQLEPDLSDVPELPQVAPIELAGTGTLALNESQASHLDETFTHTSLLISAKPGIRLFLTVAFLESVSDLLDLVLPQRPEDLLDDFQVKVMSKILENRNRLEGKGSSLEFSVRIPFTHIRFHHGFSTSGKDQFDVMLNQWSAVARIKKFPGERVGENSLSLHTTLRSLGVSAAERTARNSSQDVAVQAEFRDVLVWMLQNKATSVNVSFRLLEIAAASKKVDYLASLIHRTTLLADDLAVRFAKIEQRQHRRLRYLAWYLTSIQDQYPDPAFLTKASYALRAARDHLRSHDSWKIISRFRYTWQCLPQSEKDALQEEYQDDVMHYPEDAEAKIIHLWDQWRTWDLAHVEKSLAMKLLFNHLSDALPTPETAPLHLDVKSAQVRLIGDPGSRQSEVGLRFLTINLAILPPSSPSGLMLVGTDAPAKQTIVQISSQKTALHFQWEICELAEALMELFRKQDLQAKKVVSNKSQVTLETVPMRDEIQVVFTTQKAELVLDTINLRSTTTFDNFQVAFVDEDQRALDAGDILSVHLHMDIAISELSSRAKVLAKAQFESPSLYLALIEHKPEHVIPDEIKAAAQSSVIAIKVEEDVLGLVEIADAVLKDEVAYIVRQLEVVQHITKEKKGTEPAAEEASQLPNISLALFMDAYRVELALLQPLGWSISGSSGRIAVVPALGRNVTLQIDYDLEASFHRMYSNTGDGSHIISSLKLPALDGRLAVTRNEQATRVIASGIIDQVQIQASELQALVTTVSKPEFSHMLHAVQDDVEVFQRHIREIFPASPAKQIPDASVKTQDIHFQVQYTLSGMQIIANAPGRTPGSPVASLAFQISSVQLKATNIGSEFSSLSYPEAVVKVNDVSIDLTLTEAGKVRRCGNIIFGAVFQATTEPDTIPSRRLFIIQSSGLEVNMFAETASAVVDVVNHLQDRIKDLDLSKEKRYLRRLRERRNRVAAKRDKSIAPVEKTDSDDADSGALFTSTYTLELLDLRISWVVGNSVPPFANMENEDLVLSFTRIDLSTQRDDAARLLIDDMQLEMVPESMDRSRRALNSALLPRMVFNVAYASAKDTRKIAFHAAGKSLDLQLDSRFVMPANVIERSIALAVKKFRRASQNWSMTPTATGAQRKNPFGNKRLASLTVDVSFAGAVVHINGHNPATSPATASRSQQKGRYSQFIGDGSASSLVLRAPGVAIKVEYQDDGQDSDLNAEVRVDSSTNTLLPTVVPVLIDISNSIKAVVREKDNDDPEVSSKQSEPENKVSQKSDEEESNLIAADPTTMLGGTRLNLGLRICKQEFSLSCQPIARVTAVAKLEDIYLTANSVKSQEHGHFFAASAAFERLQTTVQHVYSRESTFSLDVESIVVSLMNSKHLSGTSGISAILKVNPTTMQINARQLQDFLLFREIWYPPEIRQPSTAPATDNNIEPTDYLIQRYEQVTAATAFPWNANVAIADVKIDLDLGQAIGKSSLHIDNMWASSKKSTTWEQNLCIGVEKIGVESTGRTSGFVELHGIKVRTSIGWPSKTSSTRRTPLIQASVAFRQLRVKSGFDYQAFAMADIADFGFLMYNVHDDAGDGQDRLVAILDGGKVHVFCHATSAAQGLALYQAIERLVQENQQAYKQSLKDIEKFLRRKSSVAAPFDRSPSQSQVLTKKDEDSFKAPISLQTDVVVSLRSIQFGVFPSTFIDQQILLLSAGDMQARFAVALDKQKIHSTLGMTLGQLSVALSAVPTPKKSKPVADLTVEDIVESARSARGGTILRVPKVIAIMHTWQVPANNHIDYLFRSTLEGKVDVGWNYSRISYIRTMWSNHSRTLASRLGKPLPESNIKISTSQTLPERVDENAPPTTTSPSSPRDRAMSDASQEKITAVVNVPQSKYIYTPLEPPVIETPQLRDMGEATPPLEWIGLHRDRLPNVTHQIVIVGLLEVAREVEDAYGRILGM